MMSGEQTLPTAIYLQKHIHLQRHIQQQPSNLIIV